MSASPSPSSSPAKKVLVTGAAGFIGSHTVDALLLDGHTVLGVDDLSTGHETNLATAGTSEAFSFEKADVAEARVLGKLASSFKPDAIVHLAALVSVPRGEEEPGLNYRLNVAATHEACEAARSNNVPRLVFASSAAVYGECDALPLDETSPTEAVSQYGAAKRVSEQLLTSYATSYGLEATSLRFFNIYGPRQDPTSPYSGVVSIFCDRYLAGLPVTIFGEGNQSRDFVFVGDIARIVTHTATAPEPCPGIFNCCTGWATSLLDVLSQFQAQFPNVAPPTHGPTRQGDIEHSLGNPAKLEAATGIRPNTTFATGLGALLDSLRAPSG